MKRTEKFRAFAAGLAMVLALSGGMMTNLYAAGAEVNAVSAEPDSGVEETTTEMQGTDGTTEQQFEEETKAAEEVPSGQQESDTEQETQNTAEVPQISEEIPEISENEETEFLTEEEVELETESEAEVQESTENVISENENSLSGDETEADIWASDDEILVEEAEALSVGASADGLPSVSYVKNTQNMDTDFALAYAFRSGMTSIDKSRTSGFSWPGGSFHTQISSSFVQDGTPGWGDDRIILKINKWDESYRNQNYVTYSNVADYNGKKLDLKITVVSWAGYNENIKDTAGNTVAPWLSFNTKKIDIAYLGIARARLRFELLYSGTSTRADVGAHTTMRDIDAGQSLWFSSSSNVSSVYLLSGNNYITEQVTAEPAPDHLELTGGSRGEQRDPDDVNTWIQLNFTGYFEAYFSEHGEWDQLKYTSQAIHFDATPKTIGLYEIPDPGKKVGSGSEGYADMAAHNSMSAAYLTSAGAKIRYEIAQTIYPGTYSSFVIKDVLDTCLTYKSASVSTAGGADASSWFQISHDTGTNTVTFKAKNMDQQYMFNNVTFYFRINAVIKNTKTITSHGHNDGTARWYILNQAKRTLGTDVKNTNTVYISGLTSGSYYVKKVDSENSSVIAEPAVFEIREWNKNTEKYTRLRDLTRDDTTLLYSTGVLTRSKANEGKFRIVETSPPKGYQGSWSQDLVLGMDVAGTTYTAPNESNILPVGDITVTKKIREADIIWAHGNPVFRFTVYGTDQKGRKYTFEDYVEFSENQYETDGEYAVQKCVFHNIPVGEYTISEKKTLLYKLESIRAETANVQISGANGVAVLSKENPSAALTFRNVKTRYDRLSHTDVVTNIIPVSQ